MSPIRILVIVILLYIGYLLIKGGSGKKKEKDPSELDGPADVSDILMEDPVCKKLVPKQQSVTAEVEGKTKYFCSQECCDRYVSEKGAEE